VNLGVQPEATRIRARQDGVALPVDVARRKDYRLVSVGLRRNLYFGESTTFQLTFELPGGKPRSASDIRVGKAFATFPPAFRRQRHGADRDPRAVRGRPRRGDAPDDRMTRHPDGERRTPSRGTRGRAQRRRSHARAAGRRGRRADRGPRLARGHALAQARVGDVLARGIPELVERIGLRGRWTAR
jgi:hypothetical protein